MLRVGDIFDSYAARKEYIWKLRCEAKILLKIMLCDERMFGHLLLVDLLSLAGVESSYEVLVDVASPLVANIIVSRDQSVSMTLTICAGIN